MSAAAAIPVPLAVIAGGFSRGAAFGKPNDTEVDVEKGLVLVKGAVPGPKGGLVLVRSAVKTPAKEA